MPATKFASSIDTSVTTAPTLKGALDKILNELVVDARACAILLSEHRRKFDRDAACDFVLSRISGILHDMSVQIRSVAESMSAETREKLSTPR